MSSQSAVNQYQRHCQIALAYVTRIETRTSQILSHANIVILCYTQNYYTKVVNFSKMFTMDPTESGVVSIPPQKLARFIYHFR